MRHVSFWSMEFSSGRRGASHLYSDRENGLADETLPPQLRSKPVRQLRFILRCPETNRLSLPSFHYAGNKGSLIGMDKNLFFDQVKSRLFS